MSSQARGIPLHSVPDNIGYRLLELPPDLLSLLESNDAPVLTLESSEPSATLKAGERTYTLRQKNTSNALIMLKPWVPATRDLNEVPQAGLAAVSTIHETVELDVAPQASSATSDKPASSRGKWHEKFGRNR